MAPCGGPPCSCQGPKVVRGGPRVYVHVPSGALTVPSESQPLGDSREPVKVLSHLIPGVPHVIKPLRRWFEREPTLGLALIWITQDASEQRLYKQTPIQASGLFQIQTGT